MLSFVAQGKLRLVKELVQRLDRVSLGTSARGSSSEGDEQGLVHLLLRR